jgi:hypothetical protein
MSALIKHSGGCHCGRVRFEVVAPARMTVSDCSCSICAKSGYLHLIVPRAHFTLLSGEESLTNYQFNTGTAKHVFCSVCGIKSFYIPRSHPDGYSVNANCLDPGTVKELFVEPFDGKEWERSMQRETLPKFSAERKVRLTTMPPNKELRPSPLRGAAELAC